ncbi:hypothetical protein [Sphingosinicella sp. CPCC 101087]|uniref:DUF6894 family protein n=1 Tax=Sphingosinicella sp. CPCC 101087 TaxID=2497754 RepID=UPI00352B60E2
MRRSDHDHLLFSSSGRRRHPPRSEGREFDSREALQRETLKEARSIISNDALEGNVNLSYHLDVEDAFGNVVHRLPFEDAVKVIRGDAAG